MKKIFFISIITSLLLVSCASNSGLSETKLDNGFISTYDVVNEVEMLEHKDLKFSPMNFYNLKDSLTGERENIRVYLLDNTPIVRANYQSMGWLFIEEILFIDSKTNTRLSLTNGNRVEEIVSGSIVRESYSVVLDQEEKETLKTILSNDPQVVFKGSKGRTDILKIKEKVSSPMLEVLNYTVE